MYSFTTPLLYFLLFKAVRVFADPICLEEFGRPTASNCGIAIDSMLKSVTVSGLPVDTEAFDFRVPSTQTDANGWASLLNTRLQLYIHRESYWLPLVWAHDDCALILAVERDDAAASGTWNGIAELAARLNNSCADTRSGPGYGGEMHDTIVPTPDQPATTNVLVQLRAIVPPNSKIDPARLSNYYVTHEALQEFVRDVADNNPWLSRFAETGGVHLPQDGWDPERAWTVPDGAQLCKEKADCEAGFSCFIKQITNSVLVYGTALIASIGTCASGSP